MSDVQESELQRACVVALRVDASLLAKIDRAAAREGLSRAAWARRSVLQDPRINGPLAGESAHA